MTNYKVTFTTSFLTKGTNTGSMIVSAKSELDAHKVFLRMHKMASIKKVEKI